MQTIWQTLWQVLEHLGGILRDQLPWGLGLAALFTVLALFQSQACNPGRPWWKSRDLLTDIQYFFLVPIVSPYARLVIMILVVAALRGAMSEEEVKDFITNGRGPGAGWRSRKSRPQV